VALDGEPAKEPGPAKGQRDDGGEAGLAFEPIFQAERQ
jgi:hypothetical protein